MMIQPDTIKNILEYGVMAPSGDNCQPWRFVVHGAELQIYNIPERDQSLYSYGQHASFFAHGALIENISIAAQAMGFSFDVKLFPNPTDTTYVASGKFVETPGLKNSLFEAIPKRMTNRKPYKKASLAPLTEDERNAIFETAKNFQGAELFLTEDSAKQNAIGYAASVNEEMLFGIERMHRFFFEHINWTLEEDAKKSTGFYIKTLELPGLAKPMFSLLKNWGTAQVLDKLGLPKQIAKGNAKNIYVTGSAHGVVTLESQQPEDFVRAGQLMERIWLTVTALGLSLQPLAGITFLMQGISGGKTDLFSQEQLEKTKTAYDTMKEAYGVKDGVLIMAFRIGYADKPSAHATRLPPNIQFI